MCWEARRRDERMFAISLCDAAPPRRTDTLGSWLCVSRARHSPARAGKGARAAPALRPPLGAAPGHPKCFVAIAAT